jgi:hypothetical protein
MSVWFVNEGGSAELTGDNFTITVWNCYESSYPGETYETQCDKINRLLAGERDLTATFSNCDGESEFTIDSDGIFRLTGGRADPPFGSSMSIFCDYESNKEELDKFMRYMLTCFDDGENDENKE